MGDGAASFRSPLTALIVALSLIVQLIAIPYHQALAASEFSASDAAAIAADLKATFGAAAALCVQLDDNGGPPPLAPVGHSDDQCPLCRFSAQVSALVRPDAPVALRRLDAHCGTIGVAQPQTGAFEACPARANRARAPPIAV